MRRLRAAIEGLDVGVLVNNAGVGRPALAYLHEADVEAWVRMVRVNLWALTEVTAAVLPGMVERGRGAVLNMGSASSEAIPSFPLNTIYAATKRYAFPATIGSCLLDCTIQVVRGLQSTRRHPNLSGPAHSTACIFVIAIHRAVQ